MGTLRFPGMHSVPALRGGVFNPGLKEPLVIDECVWYEASARTGALDASQRGEHRETAIIVRDIRAAQLRNIRAAQLRKELRRTRSKVRTFTRKANRLSAELSALYV